MPHDKCASLARHGYAKTRTIQKTYQRWQPSHPLSLQELKLPSLQKREFQRSRQCHEYPSARGSDDHVQPAHVSVPRYLSLLPAHLCPPPPVDTRCLIHGGHDRRLRPYVLTVKQEAQVERKGAQLKAKDGQQKVKDERIRDLEL